MRHLTTDELVSEMSHRCTLRLKRHVHRTELDLIQLVAEMLELAREQVPECYVQTTESTPPTRPSRAVVCHTCGGTGYMMGGVACPDCLTT